MTKPVDTESEQSEAPVDPKQAKRDELKKKALLMARKKERRAAGSDTSSAVSDLSYQSDISGLSGVSKAFITSTKEPRRVRPTTPQKQTSKLEEIKEERPRCHSPQIRDWDPIATDAGADKYSDRLSAYLEEMQQAVDFVEAIEENIKGNVDIEQLGDTKATVDKALQEHLELCKTVGEDVIDRNLQLDNDIRELECYVGKCEGTYEISA